MAEASVGGQYQERSRFLGNEELSDVEAQEIAAANLQEDIVALKQTILATRMVKRLQVTPEQRVKLATDAGRMTKNEALEEGRRAYDALVESWTGMDASAVDAQLSFIDALVDRAMSFDNADVQESVLSPVLRPVESVSPDLQFAPAVDGDVELLPDSAVTSVDEDEAQTVLQGQAGANAAVRDIPASTIDHREGEDAGVESAPLSRVVVEEYVDEDETTEAVVGGTRLHVVHPPSPVPPEKIGKMIEAPHVARSATDEIEVELDPEDAPIHPRYQHMKEPWKPQSTSVGEREEWSVLGPHVKTGTALSVVKKPIPTYVRYQSDEEQARAQRAAVFETASQLPRGPGDQLPARIVSESKNIKLKHAEHLNQKPGVPPVLDGPSPQEQSINVLNLTDRVLERFSNPPAEPQQNKDYSVSKRIKPSRSSAVPESASSGPVQARMTEQPATVSSSSWRDYLPSWLGGKKQSASDSIEADLSERQTRAQMPVSKTNNWARRAMLALTLFMSGEKSSQHSTDSSSNADVAADTRGVTLGTHPQEGYTFQVTEQLVKDLQGDYSAEEAPTEPLENPEIVVDSDNPTWDMQKGDTLTSIAKQMLGDKASERNIIQVVKKLAEDNDVSIPNWGVKGHIPHMKMEPMTLKIGGAKNVIEKLK